MATHVVQYLEGPDVTTVESSQCALFRSIPLKGCELTGLEVAWAVGT